MSYDDLKPTLRERIAALPRGAKVAGAVTAGAAVLAAGVALLWPRRGHGRHPPPTQTLPDGAPEGGTVVPGTVPVSHVTVVEVPHGRRHRRHPLAGILAPHPRRPETDPAVRRDLARLLQDVARAQRGEPPLAGATGTEEPPLAGTGLAILGTVAGLALAGLGTAAVAGASAKSGATVGFELGAYVAEALMARGIVVQMPDLPKPSAVAPEMTEKDGEAAFHALAEVDGPLDEEKLGALRDLKERSGVTFWATPGTDKRVATEVAEARARRAGKGGAA